MIWGGIRDVEQMLQHEGVQVYFRGIDPTPIREFVMKDFNGITRIGKATVLPGDVVFGKAQQNDIGIYPLQEVGKPVAGMERLGAVGEIDALRFVDRDVLLKMGDGAHFGIVKEIDFPIGVVPEHIGKETEVRKSVHPVSVALQAAAFVIKTAEIAVHRFEHTGKLLFDLLCGGFIEIGTQHAGDADGGPVVGSCQPGIGVFL